MRLSAYVQGLRLLTPRWLCRTPLTQAFTSGSEMKWCLLADGLLGGAWRGHVHAESDARGEVVVAHLC
jgi:hypothetical protein